MTVNPKEEALARAEQERQASQAAGHQAGRQADADAAAERAEAAQDDASIDPNSPEGRQAAMRRGDSVQLTGEERDMGRVEGTATTTNESSSALPSGHNFVTGAAGMPIPADQSDPQVPGSFNPEPATAGDMPEVPVSAQEESMNMNPQPQDAGTPAQSATKAEWVEHAVSRGASRDDAEAKTKDELIAEHGQPAGDTAAGGTGEHGPGVSA